MVRARMDKDADRLHQQRLAGWRITFVVTFGFVVAELIGWPLAFIVPLLAVQFLAVLPRAPTLRQGLVIVVVMTATTFVALFAAEWLLPRPGAYTVLLFGFFALGFYLDRFAATRPVAILLLISSATIPIVNIQDSFVGAALRDTLVYGAISALLLAWLAHAIFPARLAAGQAVEQPRPAAGPFFLVAAAILLLPVVLFLSKPDEASLPLLMTTLSVLRQAEGGLGERMAAGLLLGNIIGGIAAIIGYFVLTLFPFFASLCLVLLAAGLWFGGKIAASGVRAPVFVVGLMTFIVLLGLGLISISEGSSAAFISRIGGVLVGAIYSLGALILLGGVGRTVPSGPH